MKVLFLDVDGVLNNEEFFKELQDEGVSIFHRLDPRCLDHLERIVTETGCVIVVSSTWRLGKESLQDLKYYLDYYELSIHSITPGNSCSPRRDEINLWLHQNPGVEKFAILDDDKDADVGHSFFRTTFDRGLTKSIANRVIAHLNTPSDSSPTPSEHVKLWLSQEIHLISLK